MNKQRQLIYTQRNEVLQGKDVHEQILKYFEPLAEEIVVSFVDFEAGDETSVDYKNLNNTLELKLLEKGTDAVTPELCSHNRLSPVIEKVYEMSVEQYEAKLKKAEENNIDFRKTERNVLLNNVDRHWMDHIAAMDALRKGIGLRGLGQRDPVLEYRREGFSMFDEMVESIQHSTAVALAKLNIDAIIERVNNFTAMQQRRVTYVNNNANKEVGRNDPCPCGSGRKFKNCCQK
jgi:preprotein translocase subunit SecA